jgi:S1-C subfamily serine protease
MKAQLPLRRIALAACMLAVPLTVYFAWFLAFRHHEVPVGNKPPEPTAATNRGAASISEAVTNSVPSMVAPESGIGVREVVGIGVELRRPNVENGVAQIQRVLPGSPAEREGLTPGLNIHKVDGISLRGVSLSEITHLIRGPAGTKVRLELYEGVDGEKFTVELTRQQLEVR